MLNALKNNACDNVFLGSGMGKSMALFCVAVFLGGVATSRKLHHWQLDGWGWVKNILHGAGKLCLMFEKKTISNRDGTRKEEHYFITQTSVCVCVCVLRQGFPNTSPGNVQKFMFYRTSLLNLWYPTHTKHSF